MADPTDTSPEPSGEHPGWQLYQHAAWLVDSGAPAHVETSQAKLFIADGLIADAPLP